MSGGADVLATVDAESVFGAIRRGLRENRLLAIGLLMALAIVVVAAVGAGARAFRCRSATHPLQTLQRALRGPLVRHRPAGSRPLLASAVRHPDLAA